ncbi:hypothetical protein DV451_001156 [Geotrichum candidum]|uniref:Uncharacterized protein n=2 Tax=Geotrichum candidum TaxID=1173061 RepID=A0A9P5KUQ8_GEOCN|nr:hypothetical protein DV451_001156 [Geotrichum candidum]KAI9212943.1 hypothetical protein DS838_002143 [Geotrichum bryndzae]KAF5110481.1 hypothetical protein DV453_000841 [Geotrichum candidum]KAF5118927.1 hypothetical protein DV454_000291 [Geotrichum candidum]KAF5122881.1 hypothetical protein DV452_000460 [Geotrichum candidum]
MFPPPPPRKSRLGRILLYSGLVAMAAVYGYWKFVTYHNFPPEVADKLRQGLYAEGSAGGFDYKTALFHYLEALEEADKVGLHALSDEYTGLQLKIAEMYEKLGMKNEAKMVYKELGIAYITALTDDNVIPAELRPHIIQRDLRVALKTAYLESATNPQLAKIGLMVHFRLAQDEVAKKSPELAKMINGSNKQRNINIPLSLDGEVNNDYADAWKPFRDELFNARDMFVALCIATGDIGLAIQTKLTSTEWMAVSGYDASETLMSFYNAGAIFYLQAEELEVRDHEKKPTISSDGQIKSAAELAQISMGQANACFSAVLSLIKKLPSRLRRDSDIDDVQALATYGLGVIALHKGNLDKASDLLREARLRAKGCGYTDLAKNADIELDKLEKAIQDRKDNKDINVLEEVKPVSPAISLASDAKKNLPITAEK